MTRTLKAGILLAVLAGALPRPGQALTAPYNLSAQPSGYSVRLAWTAGSGNYVFEIQRRTSGSSFSTLVYAYSPSYTDGNVQNGTTYIYRVRAYDVNNNISAFTAEASATVSVTVPAPTGLTAAWITSPYVGVRLSWTGSGSSYDVRRADTANGYYTYIAYPHTTSYTDSSVALGSSYCYQVRAYNAYGDVSSYAGPICVIDPRNLPLANGLPESPHPYSNNYSNTWTYNGPADASSLGVTFDARTATESGWDKIFVLDSAGLDVSGSPFSGTQLAGRTVTVNGSRFYIRLQTDGSVTGWGFAVSAVTPFYPPLPPAPYNLKPSADGVVRGPLVLSWDPVPQATTYQLEYSTDTRTWSTAQTSATSYAPALGNGSYYWRVRAGSSRGLGSPSAATPLTVAPGYSAAMSALASDRNSLRYRISLQAFRGPPAAQLQVAGLPAGLTWSFDPPTLSGSGDSTLRIDGIRGLQTPGDYGFTIQAAGQPLDGAPQGVITVSGTLEVSEAHAFPNPSYDGTVKIRAMLSKTPAFMKMRIFDVTGALVREISENAPFSGFVESSPGVFDAAWDGRNGSGRPVAGGKYFYWLQAGNDTANDSAKGLFTVIRR